MKKIALICAICLILTMLPGIVSASGAVTVEVSDVAGDIITIKGPAPIDFPVTILILNPGMTTADVAGTPGAIQYMGAIFGEGGTFSHDIKIKTGTEPNKTEGKFTVLVSSNNQLIYSNDNFIFYSNETKENLVNDIKTATKAELLAADGEYSSKIDRIYQAYSLSSHQLYVGADKSDLAGVIAAQTSRTGLQNPMDAEAFLVKALVLCAFENKSEALKGDGGIKYTDIWAKEGEEVSTLYTNEFVNDLSEKGKSTVINMMFAADYVGAQFDKPLKVFKDAMLFGLIMNNKLMGAGHIEDYVLNRFNEEYKAAGFDTDALLKITSENKKILKLEQVLTSKSTDLVSLKNAFNTILKTTSSDKNDNIGGGLASSGGASSGGGGGTGGNATATPRPTATPTSTTSPEPTAPQSACPFTDLAGAQWANKAVEYLYKEGIISGRSETSFAPADNVTRAEFTKMILPLISKETQEIEKPEDGKIIKVACIGDSLTQGFIGEDGKYQKDTSYTDILQELLGDGFEVKNFGRSSHGIYKEHEYSYTKTDEYKNSLAYEPDVVISVFGSNDMREIYWQDIKGDYTSIYVDFIKTYTSLPSSPEVIIGLPGPVYDGEYIASRPEANQMEAKAAILKAAEELNVKVADTYTALLNMGSDALPDGLHFNKDGARTFANEIFKAMKNDIKEEPEAEVSFGDVNDGDWFSSYVAKAASAGIVNGDGGMFRPNDNITREDAALIIFRAIGLDSGSELTFTDAANISGYAKDAVAAMVKGGLINGMGDGTFAPKNTLTRAQAAQLIYNVLTVGGAE